MCAKEKKKKKKHFAGIDYPQADTLSNHHTVAWVTRPERPKGAKDEVKQARRAQSRPEGPQARSRGPEGP